MANKFFRNIVQSTGYRPFSSEAMIAKAASPVVEEGLYNTDNAAKAVVHNDPVARKQLSKANNIAAIGSAAGVSAVALGATAPLWSPYMVHGAKVLINPMSAKTTTGFLLGSAADAAGVAYGVKENQALLNKWANKEFDLKDPVKFALNMAATVPYIRATKPIVNAFQNFADAVKITVPRIKTAWKNRNFLKEEYNLKFKPKLITADDGVKELQIFESTLSPNIKSVFTQALQNSPKRTSYTQKTVVEQEPVHVIDLITGNKTIEMIEVPTKKAVPVELKLTKPAEELFNTPISQYIVLGNSKGRAYAGLYSKGRAKVDIGDPQLGTGVHEVNHAFNDTLDNVRIDGLNHVEPMRSSRNTLNNSPLYPEAEWLTTLRNAKEFHHGASTNITELNSTTKQFLYNMFAKRMRNAGVPVSEWDDEFLRLYKDELLSMDRWEFMNAFRTTNGYANDYYNSISTIAGNADDTTKADALIDDLKDFVVNGYFKMGGKI